ncbi:MAG TPA: monooxygenase [Micromonosporaceae bacterium]
MNTPYVTLDVWRTRPARLPAVLWRMARDRVRLRRVPGVRFAKLLGTGRGSRFGPARADPRRWAALIVWDDPTAAARPDPVRAGWQRLADGHCRLALRPLTSRGRWAGQEPFEPVGEPPTARDQGPVLVLTRARLNPRRAVAFWRAIGPVAAELDASGGVLAAFGIGEAPLGWQGTVSVWKTTSDLVRFAYRQPGHRRAIERTDSLGWYDEELFARFAILDVTGDRTVIGWRDGEAPTR